MENQRMCVRSAIENALQKRSKSVKLKFSDAHYKNLGETIENELFSVQGEVNQKYNECFQHFIKMINDPKNSYFRNILPNRISVKRLLTIMNIPTEKRKSIWISPEILYEIIEWIPLEDLPKVNKVNRRFWSFCDDNLEKRKYQIFHMSVTKVRRGIYKLEVTKARLNGAERVFETVTVPFAEVEPPNNFHLKSICLAENLTDIVKKESHGAYLHKYALGEVLENFLRVSKRLFLGSYLTTKPEYGPRLFKFFDNLSLINIYGNDKMDRLKLLIDQPSCINCNFLIMYPPGRAEIDLHELLNWLHSPSAIDPDAAKQLFLDFPGTKLSPLFKFLFDLEMRFLRDDYKHKFFVQFDLINKLGDIRMENPRTGEVLFTRTSKYILRGEDVFEIWEIIRCSKEDENSTRFKKIYLEKHPKISFGNCKCKAR